MAEYSEHETFEIILDAKEAIALGAAKALRKLELISTADIVEVVRCKDCLFVHTDMNGCYVCVNNGLLRKANDFCSYGKRRDLINDK